MQSTLALGRSPRRRRPGETWGAVVRLGTVPDVATLLFPSALTGPGMAAVLALGFGALAVRVGALTVSGAVVASVLAWMLLAVGGLAWAAPGVTFFALSSGWSRVGHRRKADALALADKGSQRDAAQVLANGGAAALALAVWAMAPAGWLYGAFVGAFAAAAADTWGTEIGTLFRSPTRVLAVGRQVAPGTSGGMSVPGTVGAVAGAASVVGAAALAGGGLGWVVGSALAAVGLLAAVLDSALGATIQARYCNTKNEVTERAHEGGVALRMVAGWRGVDNDVVNAGCTLAGALGGAAVWTVFA